MAEFTDRIKLVFDTVTGGAASDVGKLAGNVKQAEGGFGKLKTGAQGAFDFISKNAGLSMVAVGGAVTKFVSDAVGGFQKLALEANNFGDAVGLSVEDASRWIEVAGDLGVSTETLEGAINKMNIAASKGSLRELGIGGETANAQFVNALIHLQGITDSAERARQGMKLFGKSWTDLAPLVEEAGNLNELLAAVSDQKVIDEAEVRKAKELRDALDRLNDTLDDIKLAVGGALIPIMTGFADTIGNVTDAARSLQEELGPLGGIVGDAFDLLNPISQLGTLADGLSRATDTSAGWQEQLKGVGTVLTGNIPIIGGWADSLFGASDATDDNKAKVEAATAATKAHAEAVGEVTKALREQSQATLASFNSTLGYQDATDGATTAVDQYNTANAKAAEFTFGNAEANRDAAQALNNAEQAVLGAAAAHVKMAEDQATARGETLSLSQQNAILANELRPVAGTLAADSPLRANLLGYAAQIEAIPTDVNTVFNADVSAAIREIDKLLAKLRQPLELPPGADITQRTTARGVAPAGPAPAPAARGMTVAAAPAPPVAAPVAARPAVNYNITLNVPPTVNPAEIGGRVVEAIQAFERRSGKGWRAA